MNEKECLKVSRMNYPHYEFLRGVKNDVCNEVLGVSVADELETVVRSHAGARYDFPREIATTSIVVSC